jgi:hypothetical protein
LRVTSRGLGDVYKRQSGMLLRQLSAFKHSTITTSIGSKSRSVRGTHKVMQIFVQRLRRSSHMASASGRSQASKKFSKPEHAMSLVSILVVLKESLVSRRLLSA